MKINRSRVPDQCAFDEMVGTNLHYIRRYRKLTMVKVAKHIPFTFQQLGKYENGKNTISAYKLLKLCKIYNVDIDKIVRSNFIGNHQAIISIDPGVSTEQIKMVDKEHARKADTYFDPSIYEEFEDEYPAPLSNLEDDHKMRATYDAILGGRRQRK